MPQLSRPGVGVQPAFRCQKQTGRPALAGGSGDAHNTTDRYRRRRSVCSFRRSSRGWWRGGLDWTGLDWTLPDFSTLSRRQKTLKVTIAYRGSQGPLHLLIDNEALSAVVIIALTDGATWLTWRKIHLGIDAQTREIRAVESSLANATAPKEPVDGSHIGDAPVLPGLPGQVTPDQEIGSVTADGACDTRNCHNAIADRGAHAFGHSVGPVAVMPSLPPRRNARPWMPTTAGAIARNGALRASKYLGRAICRNRSGYHRRSRAETKMHCMKLLGQRLMGRDFERQDAEVQDRIAILNGYTALGDPVTKTLG